MKTLRRLVALAVLVAIGFVAADRLARDPGPTGGWLAEGGLNPQFEAVEGVRLRYVRTGQGPTLVLLHGFASSIVTWKDALPLLAAHHDVIAVDLPGFGGSDVPPAANAALYARFLPALLDRLQVARASVAGNSLGGALAVSLAAAQPDRVERLVLIDAAGYNMAVQDRPWMLRLLGHAPVAKTLDRLPTRRGAVLLSLRQVFHDDDMVTEARVDEYLAPLLRPGSVPAMHGLLTQSDSLGLPESIARVRAPTLVIWGADDTWIPLSDADRFLAAIPGARKVVVQHCGHMPQEERPVETAQAMLAFLAERAGVTPPTATTPAVDTPRPQP